MQNNYLETSTGDKALLLTVKLVLDNILLRISKCQVFKTPLQQLIREFEVPVQCGQVE